ncbi:GtrA family protein [Microbacterium sp. CCNWLW134]|uniref:GtrA family protein n=1 Tax=Microbacterium sp. CCNWLW134 TaxID=3122064 RepID=UPI00300F8F3A
MRDLMAAVTKRPEVRYLVFGGLNTAFSYLLFSLCLLALHAWSVPGDYAIAITFSWLVSNLTSFLLQRRFVFRGTGRPVREFIKFTSVTFGSFLANLGLSWFSAEVLGFDSATEKLVSQLVVTVVLVVITYVLHRSFSFRKTGAEPAGMVAVEEDPHGTDDGESARSDTRMVDG